MKLKIMMTIDVKTIYANDSTDPTLDDIIQELFGDSGIFEVGQETLSNLEYKILAVESEILELDSHLTQEKSIKH